jgi:hypothetical protein
LPYVVSTHINTIPEDQLRNSAYSLAGDYLLTPIRLQETSATRIASGESLFTKWRVSTNLENDDILRRRSHRLLSELGLFSDSVSWSRNVEYLGITYDGKLLWNERTYKTANKTLARILKLYPLLGYHSILSHVIKP